MLRQRLLLYRLALLLVDGVLAAVLFGVVSVVRFGDRAQLAWQLAGAPWWVWAAAYGILWMVAEWLQELDRIRSHWTARGEAAAIIRAVMLLAVTVFSLLFLVKAPQVSRQFLLILFASQIVAALAFRRLIRMAFVLGRNHGLGLRNVLILGTGPAARRMADHLESHPAMGYRVIGHLGEPADVGRPILGPLDAIEGLLHESVIDEVVACLAADEAAYVDPVVSLCHDEGKLLRVLVQPGLVLAAGGRTEVLADQEVLTISNGPDRILGLLAKRLLDIVLAGLALVILAPFLAVVAVAIKLGDGGPVLFRQTRVGLHGRLFTMMKFRSMVLDAEARKADLAHLNVISGQAFKVTSDPRITRVGAMLRRTSIDELPQLWNVLRGQMSIVGPRPPLVEEVAGYDLWHRRRLSMKPGITGLWQVSARLEEEFDRWVELDLWYIDRWSLWLDLKIMVRTIPAMLMGR